jgi:hypothetical protein
LIYAQFPWSGLWVLGLFLAIELLFDGWALIMLAFALQAIPTEGVMFFDFSLKPAHYFLNALRGKAISKIDAQSHRIS